MELSERKRQILKVVVEDFIRTAEPIGSKTIAEEMGGSCSSATIRNELADLVDMGYLEQPHTSAGRIPSPKGYRFYVNELMEQQKLSIAETDRINQSLQMKMKELDHVLAQAGKAVASFVNYPTYMATSSKKKFTVRRFDLLPVDDRSCIVVVMMGNNRVRSQILPIQLHLDPGQLSSLAEFLNTHFTGCSTDEMNLRLMGVAETMAPPMFLLLNQVITYAVDTIEEADRKEVITAGANQILKLPEFRDSERAHELIQFMTDSKESLPMVEEGPVKILIGPENINEVLKESSVVMASYDIGDDMRGLIGVVGPTRMDYATVAARLSGYASGLARLFGKQELPPKED